MENDWYSAFLIYSLDSHIDPACHRCVESLIVFRAKDFQEAKNRAVSIGRQYAEDGKVYDNSGSIAIEMKLCRVLNLDIIGPNIEGAEVWSKVSELDSAMKVDLISEPTQTI